MSIWGKLIGGAAGMALGGPIGAILGIAAGHGVDKVRKFDTSESNKNFSNDQKEQIFATSVIAISAKLAKADGKISKSEILAFKKIFEFPAEDEKAISNILTQLKKILMTIRILLNRFIKYSNLIEGCFLSYSILYFL